MKNGYLESTKEQLLHYKSIADRSFQQLPEDKYFFWKPTQESNSIWVLVKHLHGNMLSRFTDVFTTDGEKEWRDRDDEFEENAGTKTELMRRWNEGWDKLFATLDNFTEQDLSKEVFLKNKPLSLLDFINQAVFHYLYHVGQIVYISKMVVDHDWKMLWGPKKK